MCYKYGNDEEEDAYEKYYEEMASVHRMDKFAQSYLIDGFVHPEVLVATNDGRLTTMKWGLIPHWCKNRKKADEMAAICLNSVSETAFDKPSFRYPIRNNRCLVPMTGFFEWMHVGKQTYPHYIYLKEAKEFSVAGIYDRWVDQETGEEIESVAILTTKANPLMEKIHNTKKRMPAIILREYEKDYLNPNLTKEDVLALCQPIDEKLMAAHTISKLITSRSKPRNIPELIERFEYPELGEITL